MPHSKPFRWFAWRPVVTDDRGLRWLRLVWRSRFYFPVGLPYAPGPVWTYRVEKRDR